MPAIDRSRLTELLAAEQATYTERHPRSRALFEEGTNLFGRVPMTWMNKWTGGFPLYLDHARGNRVTDVDGHTYVDFALGDTGAMAGHSPRATVEAVARRMGDLGRHHDDAAERGRPVGRRRADPALRDAAVELHAVGDRREPLGGAAGPAGHRQAEGPRLRATATTARSTRPSRCPGPTARRESRPGNVAPPVPLDLTTRAATWNDLASVERELAHGDVAAILTEPALTNIGIVLPEPGFLEGLRELATRHGALLMIDETHTFSAGWGGATTAWGLEPDIFVIGKSIGGGIPSGAYGITDGGRGGGHPPHGCR